MGVIIFFQILVWAVNAGISILHPMVKYELFIIIAKLGELNAFQASISYQDSVKRIRKME